MSYNIDYFISSSRYLRNVDVFNFSNGLKVPSLLNSIKFISDDIESYYTTASNDVNRLDLISYKLYGTVDFWWAIAAANYIEIPQDSPIEGEVLAIPSSQAIQRYL